MSSLMLSKAIAKAKELSIWISRNIDGIRVVSGIRSRLAVGSLHLAFDHHDAVILLAEHEIYGSAFALLRLMIEAYVHGAWLIHCGSETDLDKFENKDELDRTFGGLINDLEKLEDFNVGVLLQMKQDSWKLLNSFTHGGYHHIRRRNTLDGIEANYPECEVVAALNFAGAVAILSTVELAKMAKNNELLKEAYERSKSLSI